MSTGPSQSEEDAPKAVGIDIAGYSGVQFDYVRAGFEYDRDHFASSVDEVIASMIADGQRPVL